MVKRIGILVLLACPVWAQVNTEVDEEPEGFLPPASRPKADARPGAAVRPAEPLRPSETARPAAPPRRQEAIRPEDTTLDADEPTLPRTPAPRVDAKRSKPSARTKPRAQSTQPVESQAPPTPENCAWLVRAKHGLVASDSAEASEAGAKILESGGNAIDAAVATSFALGVTRPYSTGLGGGGFALIYLSQKKEILAFDFRETAPGDATWDMFIEARKKDPNGPPPSQIGGLAVAVPGLLAGVAQILEQYGTCRLDRVIEPAIELADGGFKADADYVNVCKQVIAQYKRDPRLQRKCPTLYATLLNNGVAPTVGQVIHRPELASALRLIQTEGPAAFYEGRIADAILTTVEKAGGILRIEDLLSYRVRERTPLRWTYRNFEIVSMPPPSSGGVVLAEVLNILGRRPLGEIHAEDPGKAAHLFIEACKHAFADRSRWLGDPSYVNVPVSVLTGEKHAAALAEKIDEKKTQPSKSYGTVRLTEDGGTSHFCVVDVDDNVVAWTETINLFFGSYVVTEPFGIILNNEMDDFSAEPGKPDAFGLRTSDRNAVAPGKRPLSSMSPTIVLDSRGQPVLTLGASGGSKIISSVLSVLINILDYDMPLGEAINAVRIHHQWMPDEVCFSADPPDDLVDALKERKHVIGKPYSRGVVQAIEWQSDNTLLGASDPRKGGRPAGY